MRSVVVYRDDSTTPVEYERVKHVFWTAGNTVLVLAVYREGSEIEHDYVHWPRERVCWFRVSGRHHG